MNRIKYLTILLFIITGCSSTDIEPGRDGKYQFTIAFFIPDSNLVAYRSMLTELTTASHKQFSGGKIEEAKIHYTVLDAAFDMYKIRGPGLIIHHCPRCESGGDFVPYHRLTLEEKIIFNRLKETIICSKLK